MLLSQHRNFKANKAFLYAAAYELALNFLADQRVSLSQSLLHTSGKGSLTQLGPLPSKMPFFKHQEIEKALAQSFFYGSHYQIILTYKVGISHLPRPISERSVPIFCFCLFCYPLMC